MSTTASEPRVAIIAVHGVADQAPGDSAEALAALLLSRNEEGTTNACYEPFQARTIYVPLAPACAGAVASDFVQAAEGATAKAAAEGKRAGEKLGSEKPKDEKPAKPGLTEKLANAFQESQTGYRATLQEHSENKASEDAGLIYMRSLLGSYRGQAGRQSYKTLRLEGKRCDSGGIVGPAVDIYELYWADLSQLGSGPVRVFSSLYQLVLHISELGRRALEDGFSEFGSDKRWQRLVKYQELAVRQLTVAIPLFNLVLLATLLTAVLTRIAGGTVTTPDGKPLVSVDSPTLRIWAIAGATILTVALAYRLAGRVQPNRMGWWVLPIASIPVGALLGYGVVIITGHPDLVLLAESWAALVFGVNALLKKYDRVRPGALGSGRLILIVAGLLFVTALAVAMWENLYPREIEYAALWTLQALNTLLLVFWISVVLAAAYASLLGSSILRSLTDGACARATAAIRTSRLTLGIAAGSMLGILVIVWSGVIAWGVAHVHAFDCMEASVFTPLRGLGWLVADPSHLSRWLGDSTQCAGINFGAISYFRAVLLMGVTSGLPVSLFLVTVCVLLLVWLAMPSVRYEGESPSKCTNAESEKAGIWLSRGLDATKVITWIWWVAVFVVLVIFGFGDFAARQGWELGVFQGSKRLTLLILSSIGTLVAASAAALAYAVVRFGGSALDVLLDVDNYLRELPHDGTPRAMIAERYASLLRYIAHDKGKNGQPYDYVVIVAHSLGAVITCDLLRFLIFERDSGRGDAALEPLGYGKAKKPGGPDIPIRLFTMGNPLRQLLNRFFPHQYQWVRDEPDNAMRPDPRKAKPKSTTPKPATPSADALGVKSWANAYRSGDYVGRNLWTDEWFKRTSGPKPDDGPYPQEIKIHRYGQMEEMCIGLGAHTHYWDETAPDIRDQLDLLVAPRAARKPVRPPASTMSVSATDAADIEKV